MYMCTLEPARVLIPRLIDRLLGRRPMPKGRCQALGKRFSRDDRVSHCDAADEARGRIHGTVSTSLRYYLAVCPRSPGRLGAKREVEHGRGKPARRACGIHGQVSAWHTGLCAVAAVHFIFCEVARPLKLAAKVPHPVRACGTKRGCCAQAKQGGCWGGHRC